MQGILLDMQTETVGILFGPVQQQR